jgi:hypothetical protein
LDSGRGGLLCEVPAKFEQGQGESTGGGSDAVGLNDSGGTQHGFDRHVLQRREEEEERRREEERGERRREERCAVVVFNAEMYKVEHRKGDKQRAEKRCISGCVKYSTGHCGRTRMV